MSTMNAVPLTKSQKKRMKRNKAKSRKAEASNQAATTASTTPTVLDPLNAHDALRIGLQDLGFELKDIDAKIEEMWNLGLEYGDMNAVAAFMTEYDSTATSQINTASEPSTTTKENTTTNTNTATVVLTKSGASEEESKTVSTASMSTSVSVSVTPPPKEVTGMVPLTVTNPIVNSISEADETTRTGTTSTCTSSTIPVEKPVSVTNHGSSSSSHVNGTKSSKATRARKAAVKAPPPSLKTKLNIVANDENLTDAIVALTEWIVKAATPFEVKQLCDTNEPCALRTVIRRVIVAPGPRNFSGQLLDLIGSILRIAGIPSTELSMSARALMHTLTKAKSTISMTTTTTMTTTMTTMSGEMNMSDNVADFVTDTVVSFISNAVEKISCTASGEDITVEQLNGELQRVKSILIPNSSGNVGALVAKRDQLKNLTQKHSQFLTGKIASSKSESGDRVVSSLASFSEKDMMAQVFGNKYEEMVASKAKYDELKKRQVESHSSLSEREEIVSNIEALDTKKKSLSDKIKEMELELKRLKTEETSFNQQMIRAQNTLTVLDESLSTEAKEVEKSMSDMAQNIKLNDSVLDVVQSLSNFHKEMDNAVSAEITASEAASGEETQLDLSPYMTSYISCTSDYFNTEYKLVSFLQRRAQNLRDGFPRLEMEIEECSGLGMTSNVVEMKKKLNQMQQNIVDDDNIIKALQKEAEEMKTTLAGILRQYKATGADAKSYEASCKQMESVISAII